MQPEYDSLDRVSALSYNGTKTYAFQYSSDNKLGSTVDYENDMSWNYAYDNNGNLVRTNGSDGTVIRNLQGDVIALEDQSGTIVAKYSYDSWGNVLFVTDRNDNAITSPTHVANQNPIRYICFNIYRGYIMHLCYMVF